MHYSDSTDVAEAKKFLTGNRLRITQTTGNPPQWYEGTITTISRSGDDYSYTFDAGDDLDSTTNDDADAKRLPESGGL